MCLGSPLRANNAAIGRSRGGLTTKVHALVDAEGRPIALKLTEDQAHDGRSAADLVTAVGAGQILIADRAYDSDQLRNDLAARGGWANVRPRPNRKRRPAFRGVLYRYRNLVERFFGRTKPMRAVATRYAKDPATFLALVKLAAVRFWLRRIVSVS